jgi:hypothetical protein
VAIASIGYVAALVLMGVSNAIANIRRPLDGILHTSFPLIVIIRCQIDDFVCVVQPFQTTNAIGEPLRDLAFEYLPHFHTNDLANNLVYGGITFTSWVVILHPRRRHLCRRLLTMYALHHPYPSSSYADLRICN